MKKRICLVLLIMAIMTTVVFTGGKGAEASESKRYKIGAIVPTLNAQFWNNYVNFMKTGAEELGVDLIVLNCDNKADLLPKYIEDLVSQQVDGIIVVPAGVQFALISVRLVGI